MRMYRGAVCCDVVFHTMLGMLVREGGHREFWIIGKELQELVVSGCYGVEVWRRHWEGDDWDRGEGGGIDEPLALGVDQERVGAQEICSENWLGNVGEDEFLQETL